jgi:hypothetical protein
MRELTEDRLREIMIMLVGQMKTASPATLMPALFFICNNSVCAVIPGNPVGSYVFLRLEQSNLKYNRNEQKV